MAVWLRALAAYSGLFDLVVITFGRYFLGYIFVSLSFYFY